LVQYATDKWRWTCDGVGKAVRYASARLKRRRKASRVTSNVLSHGGIKKIRSPTAVKMIGA
jgi:hypothetical protein